MGLSTTAGCNTPSCYRNCAAPLEPCLLYVGETLWVYFSGTARQFPVWSDRTEQETHTTSDKFSIFVKGLKGVAILSFWNQKKAYLEKRAGLEEEQGLDVTFDFRVRTYPPADCTTVYKTTYNSTTGCTKCYQQLDVGYCASLGRRQLLISTRVSAPPTGSNVTTVFSEM